MNEINHIGIIMDGNRRWAKIQGFNSYKGHDQGAEVFKNLCDWCLEERIKYLTVYAFSTENWRRPSLEVNHIFKLLEKFFKQEKENCIEKNIRVKVIGERSRFNKKTLTIIEDMEDCTKHCAKLNVQIALSYGGRDEIVRAVKKLIKDVNLNQLSVNDITEDVFSSYLDTENIPDVDLVVRSGGSKNSRLSNFLIWQTAYSELYFSDFLWPEFTRKEFKIALEYYGSVKRKIGK